MPELNRKITSLSRNPAERVLSLYPLEGRPILLASRPKDGANFDFQLGETDMVRSDLSDSNDSLANQIAPVVCSEGKWRLGGLIAYLHREYTWLRERIPTLPQNLPSHCVDPLQIARFLVEDIRGFDWHGPDASQVMAAIKRIEQKLEGGSIRKSAVDTASQMLTTKEVSNLIGCSYSQARALMLDGRIKSMKDGRLLRSRREWVEEYLLAQVVKKPEPQPEEIKTKHPKAKLVGQFKKGGLAYEFLRSRPD